LLLQGSTTLAPRFVAEDTLSVGTAGRLDVIVDWTFASSPIAVYVGPGSCTLEQLNARSCNFLIRSESGPKPRKLSASVAPGSYFYIVGNAATAQEALSTQVFLSSTSCPSITTRPTRATQTERDSLGSFVGVSRR
jgi:hypothetical protein